MKSNFEPCFTEVLRHEGGWAEHPSDPGGATMKGVTIGTFARYKRRDVSKAELKAISDHDLRTIYRKEYWDKVRGDELPAGIDLATFDPAINSGPSRGVKWMQTALRVPADGQMGPQTIRAARGAQPVEAIQRACAARMGFLRGLKTWVDFKNGWSRRVAAIEAAGVRMALAAHGAPVRETLAAEAKRADTKAKTEAGKATGGAVAGGSGISLSDMPDWGIALAAVLLIALVVIIIGQMRHERERAAAYGRESNA